MPDSSSFASNLHCICSPRLLSSMLELPGATWRCCCMSRAFPLGRAWSSILPRHAAPTMAISNLPMLPLYDPIQFEPRLLWREVSLLQLLRGETAGHCREIVSEIVKYQALSPHPRRHHHHHCHLTALIIIIINIIEIINS